VPVVHVQQGTDMNMWLERFTRSLQDAEGQDLLEYSMLVALIAVVAAGAVSTVGNTINTALWQVIAASSV
jgi:Flp pilus assembly pilin Flp